MLGRCFSAGVLKAPRLGHHREMPVGGGIVRGVEPPPLASGAAG